ncbi:glycosyltransferase [Candidatus Kaiserbacteria bacterium]|nr:glycosyltransferase [Candidatus Kaiserbacteria bacterium]
MDITLIIPAYNEEKEIGACIDAVKIAGRGRFREIVVVDNASTDRTADVAREHGARVVLQPIKGLTHARQAGFDATQGEWVSYIDADTHLPSEWFDKAERIIGEHQNVVALSGPRRYFGTAPWRRWILNSMWATAPVSYRTAGYMILGGNFIARRDAIEKIGGFNQDIAFYGEDTDLAKRLSKVGKVLFRMDFFVYASARRFEEEGIFKPNIVYALNFLWPILFGRPYTVAYKDVRDA